MKKIKKSQERQCEVSQKCVSSSSFPLTHLWCQIMSLFWNKLYPRPAFLLLNGKYHRTLYNERLDVLIKLPSHRIMCPGLRSEKWLQRSSNNLYLLDETKLRMQGHQITSNCKPHKTCNRRPQLLLDVVNVLPYLSQGCESFFQWARVSHVMPSKGFYP